MSATSPTPQLAPDQAPFEAELARVRGLLEQGRFADAFAAATGLSAAAPHHRDVLYMLAVSQRCLQRVDDALATLDALEQWYPTYPRLYQERGHCFVARREAAPAIAAFEKALSLNAALPASWNALQVLYRIAGRDDDARLAVAQAAKLAKLPPEIVTATSMYSDGEVAAAEELVRRYLLVHGDHPEGMRLLAKIAYEADFADDAEQLLEVVLAKEPGYKSARYDYALALLKQQKHVEALQQIRLLLADDPTSHALRTTLAAILAGKGDDETALTLYAELIRERPSDADLYLCKGHALKTRGGQQAAVAAYRRAIELRPRFGDAWFSLSNLKTYRFTDAEIEQMRAQESDPMTSLQERYQICFALGKALEDRKAYGDSFEYYSRGNALKKSECRYRHHPITRNTKLQKEICTSEFFAARRDWGVRSAEPIFIVGLPRAGSTLLEQILASHSKVEGTMELALIPRLVSSLHGRDADREDPLYPKALLNLKAEDIRAFGENYLRDSQPYRTGKPHFIDKMPNNFRHLGLIHLMLPHAKIIDARREPMACCFSNFKQMFASGQQFTYSLEDIAGYYRTYVELMDHWDQVLPGRVLRVQHEELVADLETIVRRVLDFCGLEFEPACLEFHKTQRQVHTASSEQVRRPISTEGVDQWRHFEPWLGPLRAALGPLAPP